MVFLSLDCQPPEEFLISRNQRDGSFEFF